MRWRDWRPFTRPAPGQTRANWRGWRRALVAAPLLAVLVGLVVVFRGLWDANDRPLTLAFFALYLLGTFLGWLNFGLWLRGPSYFPAGKLLALATGLPGGFYGGLYVLYGFDRPRLMADIAARNYNVLLYALIVACQGWAAYLILRQNFFTKPGATIDVLGGEHKPSREQIAEALIVIERAEIHELLNVEQGRRLRAQRDLLRARRAAEGGKR